MFSNCNITLTNMTINYSFIHSKTPKSRSEGVSKFQETPWGLGQTENRKMFLYYMYM